MTIHWAIKTSEGLTLPYGSQKPEYLTENETLVYRHVPDWETYYAPEDRCGSCQICHNSEGVDQSDDPLWRMSHSFMIVCATCGNKRCPKAYVHTNECTHSNAPGQPGSAYV